MAKLAIGIIIGIIITVIGVKVFDFKSSVQVKDSPQPQPITQQLKYDRLRKLSVDVQLAYYTDLLGKPTYVNYLDDTNQKEVIFVDPDYFVQTITDSNDKVLSYAVTSRNKDFIPKFGIEGLFSVILHQTPFSDWLTGVPPLHCYQFIGLHDPLYYFEEQYFGNPGLYLTYLVGINNSAPSDKLPAIEGNQIPGGEIDCQAVNQEDRRTITPNTYIVRLKETDQFGPSNIQVRTLNE